jgi:hypothetical protein
MVEQQCERAIVGRSIQGTDPALGGEWGPAWSGGRAEVGDRV